MGSVTSATISLPQWITIVDEKESKNIEQAGGNYSATSSFNNFDNIDALSDTSSVAISNNKNQKGGATDIQDINKLVTISEADSVRIEDFDTVTSVTATSVLENKLRDLF